MKNFIAKFVILAAFAVLIGCGRQAVDKKMSLDAESFDKKMTLDTESLLAGLLNTAQEQDQRILIHVGAPGWGWCNVLEEFLKENADLFAEDYVILKIDTQNMENGEIVANRLSKGRGGGIPWIVILDSDGTELITSFGPDGNIGCPIAPEEISYFVAMIEQTRRKISPEGVAKISEARYANARNQRRS
jgi:hypothetical protein